MTIFTKLTTWYFKRNAIPYWFIIIADCTIIFFAFLAVHQMFHSVSETMGAFCPLCASIAIYLFFALISFRIFHTYAGILRYSSFIDLQQVGLAMLVTMACAIVAKYVIPANPYMEPLRLREIFVATVGSVMMMWGVRVLVKFLYDMTFNNINAQRTFIYGVRDGAVGLAKNIRNEKPTRFLLEGFISPDPKLQNKVLMGVKIYSNDHSLVDILKKKDITAVLVSPLKNNEFRRDRELQNMLIDENIHIYMMPMATEWGDHKNMTQIKEVDIEDLLPREEIDVDMNAVGQMLWSKKILITGAAGSIGREMVKQIAKYNPKELILVDVAETPLHDIRLMMMERFPHIDTKTIVASICNIMHMEMIFRENCPDYVFHAAAYKHVPMMEDNPGESVHNNINGTKVIADLSVKYFVKKFVMISTDKAVNPTNVMGCSKRICEIYVQSLDKAIKEGKVRGETQFVTTRFGNVLGSNGSVIPLFRQQIRKGGPVTVTDPDIIRYFMLIPEACKLVLEAGTKGKGGEIFIFDMGEPVRIADLAKRMIQLSGVKDVKIEYTGLREGEKLYEEVLNKNEETKPTFHPKIKIAKVREYDYRRVCSDIDRLSGICLSYNDMEIVKEMKAIVPEYKSNNSKYEVLDKK